MNEEVLEEIGLTKSEIHVYLALLELGSSSTGKIIEKSKASSSKIYEILDRLIDKGLVSFIIKAGVKHFEAAPPERIMDYMKEKEEKLTKQKDDLKKVIPELKLKQTLAKYKSEATIYKGMKGVETAFYSALNLLTPKDEMLVIGIPSRSETVNRFFLKFGIERGKRKIKIRALANEAARGEPQLKAPLTNVKYIPEITPAAINIFKDRVIIFPEADEPLLIVIDNKEVADSFRVQFERWWDQTSTVYRGEKQVKYFLEEVLLNQKEAWFIGAKMGMKEFYPKYWEWYNKERVKRKCVWYDLLHADVPEKDLPTDPYYKYKRLPPELKSPNIIGIIGNKIANILWYGKEPTIFVIENKELVKSYKKYFNLLWDQKTIMYTGSSGVKSFFNELINEKEVWFIGGNFGIKKDFPEYWKWYMKESLKRKQIWHDLIDVDVNIKEIPISKYYAYKILPPELKSPHVICISKNKVANILWAGEKTTIFVLENKDIVDSYKKYFDLLWKQDTIVEKGFQAYDRAMHEALEELKPGESYEILGAAIHKEKTEKFSEMFHREARERFKKSIGVRMLFYREMTPAVKKYIEEFAGKKTELKFLPYGGTDSPVETMIYKNKIILATQEKEPTVVTIKNKKITDSFRNHFNSLWDQNTVVEKGLDALDRSMHAMLDELKQGEEYIVLGAYYNPKIESQLRQMIKKLHKRRIKKGIKTRLLFCKGQEKIAKETQKEFYERTGGEYRFLPYESKSPMEICIHKDKIELIIKEEIPTVITITDPKVAEGFRAHFELLWKQAE